MLASALKHRPPRVRLEHQGSFGPANDKAPTSM